MQTPVSILGLFSSQTFLFSLYNSQASLQRRGHNFLLWHLVEDLWLLLLEHTDNTSVQQDRVILKEAIILADLQQKSLLFLLQSAFFVSRKIDSGVDVISITLSLTRSSMEREHSSVYSRWMKQTV